MECMDPGWSPEEQRAYEIQSQQAFRGIRGRRPTEPTSQRRLFGARAAQQARMIQRWNQICDNDEMRSMRHMRPGARADPLIREVGHRVSEMLHNLYDTNTRIQRRRGRRTQSIPTQLSEDITAPSAANIDLRLIQEINHYFGPDTVVPGDNFHDARRDSATGLTESVYAAHLDVNRILGRRPAAEESDMILIMPMRISETLDTLGQPDELDVNQLNDAFNQVSDE